MSALDILKQKINFLDEKMHFGTMHSYFPAEEGETTMYADDQQYITTDSFEGLEFIIRLSNENYMKIFGIYNSMLNMCPNKKVVHLAENARKPRTRKKNFNRAIKIVERGDSI